MALRTTQDHATRSGFLLARPSAMPHRLFQGQATRPVNQVFCENIMQFEDLDDHKQLKLFDL